jgi:hypothetical protein
VGTVSDVAVDLEYGGGNVASWSSRLGGAPTDLSAPTSSAPTPSTTPVAAAASPTTAAAPASKPWWKQPFVTALAILVLMGAGLWFGFEMRASRRRRLWVVPEAGRQGPPGWGAAPGDASIELAKQLVRLTEIIVQLATVHPGEHGIADDRARARSPDAEAAPAPASPGRDRFEGEELRYARAGPAPPEPARPAETPVSGAEQSEVVRSASPTPGDVARSTPRDEPGGDEPGNDEPGNDEPGNDEPGNDEPVGDDTADPRPAMMARLMDLDRQRRRLRDWMDADDSGEWFEPPTLETGAPCGPADPTVDIARYRARRPPRDSS